jgi:Flp pilus assembly protein TadD
VRQGRWEDSIPEYQRSIALKATGDGYTSLGTAFFYLGRYSEALPNFQKAAQLDPRNPVALGNLGSAYRQLNDRAKADEAFSRAIAAGYDRLQLNPTDAMMLGYEAVLHAYKGQIDEAVSLVGRARAIDPASNELMYDEAVVHALSGPSHAGAAMAALERAIENGYSRDEAVRDPDLKTLKNLAEFKVLLGDRSR